MDEDFELPVNINGKEKILQAKFIRFGYSYKIEVGTGEEVLLFEPDEERNWRAVLIPESMDRSKTTHPDLYRSIAEALDKLFR